MIRPGSRNVARALVFSMGMVSHCLARLFDEDEGSLETYMMAGIAVLSRQVSDTAEIPEEERLVLYMAGAQFCDEWLKELEVNVVDEPARDWSIPGKPNAKLN